MDLADGCRKVDGEPQKLGRFEPLIEKAIKGISPIVLEHERSRSAIANQRQRPRRPSGIKIAGQRVFVLEPLDKRLSAGDKRQHWNRIVELPSPMQRKLPVVSQRLQLVTGEVHLHGPYPKFPRLPPSSSVGQNHLPSSSADPAHGIRPARRITYDPTFSYNLCQCLGNFDIRKFENCDTHKL